MPQSSYDSVCFMRANSEVWFELLTVLSMNMAVFWVVAPCRLVWVYRRFRGLYCLHHQGDESRRHNPEHSHLKLWSSLSRNFLSPLFRHVLFPSKYPPQHPVLKHPKSVFFSECDLDFTGIQNEWCNYICVYFYLYLFTKTREDNCSEPNLIYS
jgi:hypothetical protein